MNDLPDSVTPIHDPTDPRVRDYFSLTDVALRRVLEPREGLYLAESAKVISRALTAGHHMRSLLMGPRWLTDLAPLIHACAHHGIPVYVAPPTVIEAMTGFHLHRGAIAAMHRPVLPPLTDVLATARRIVVLEDIVDHTNVGCSKAARTDPLNTATPQRSRIAVFENLVDHTNLGAGFRSAAAFGLDAVLITPNCADPLYRRSIRVSMGTVFQVPWTRIDRWPDGIAQLKGAGYVVAGMTLADDAITLDELTAEDHPRLALVFGTEGHGLTPQATRQLDRRVAIPMSGGVDSLNVAAAAAVAFYTTR